LIAGGVCVGALICSDTADLAALGFDCWLWAAATAQKNAKGIINTAASFI
jgi:hypothetical protein